MICESRKCGSVEMHHILSCQIERLLTLGFMIRNSPLHNHLQQGFKSLPTDIQVAVGPGVHPLLLVIPFSIVHFKIQIESVRLKNENKSYTFLDLNQIRDIDFEISKSQPFLLFNVEDGRYMCGQSPKQAVVSLRQSGRRAFTVNECLALSHQKPETFDQHNIHASGSRIEDKETGMLFVPDFYIYAGKLKMKRDGEDDADLRWGTPSYDSFVTLS